MRRALVVLPKLLVAGCGGGSDTSAALPFTVASYGHSASRVWIYEPGGETRAVAVFVHGAGDVRETTPYDHRPWLDHLVRTGVAVAYPRYELYPGAPGALEHLEAGAGSRREGSPATSRSSPSATRAAADSCSNGRAARGARASRRARS